MKSACSLPFVSRHICGKLSSVADSSTVLVRFIVLVRCVGSSYGFIVLVRWIGSLYCFIVLIHCISSLYSFVVLISFIGHNALNRKSRRGTGTHLSEQRRRSSAHGRRAAHVPTLWYQHFVSYAPVTQQAEKRRCASTVHRFISYAPTKQQAEKRHCCRG